ncbi:MAG: hypothetical protein M3198_02925 [Actinomycetota bacterium]|nr:hypothetical protein [Actinomycetota bacterium]
MSRVGEREVAVARGAPVALDRSAGARRRAGAKGDWRHQILEALVSGAALSGLAAAFIGGAALPAHVAFDLLLALYVLLLQDQKRQRERMRTKVRPARTRVSARSVELFDEPARAAGQGG